MTEDSDFKEQQSDSGGTDSINKARDKKTRNRPLTKIIVRRLPPSMSEEAFLEQVSPIPEHDFFYFAKPDPSLGHCGFSRAYINFVNVDDIFLFKEKFDGYVFLDERGVEYVGIVEYSPFQRIPKRRKKKDPKCNTIESDPIYQEFIESLKEPEGESKEPRLEYSYPVGDGSDKKDKSTPLLEYLIARKQDKRARDERRRRENDKRKMRVDRAKPTKDLSIKEEDDDEDTKKIKVKEWDKDKATSKKKDEETKSSDSKEAQNNSDAKSYRDQRKAALLNILDKKKKDADKKDDVDDKKDRRDKFKESPRDQKSKKYSDTRKERVKQPEVKLPEKVEEKKKLNHDDIKPFTRLPQVKTDDLVKVIEEMDRQMKLEEASKESKSKDRVEEHVKKIEHTKPIKLRRSSLESSSESSKDEPLLVRQKSLDERGNSTDREDSLEKDRDEAAERRAERRIRNKDRPSLAIYQPGMGKFSKQRISKDKETSQTPTKTVSDAEKKDT